MACREQRYHGAMSYHAYNLVWMVIHDPQYRLGKSRESFVRRFFADQSLCWLREELPKTLFPLVLVVDIGKTSAIIFMQVFDNRCVDPQPLAHATGCLLRFGFCTLIEDGNVQSC